MRKINWKTKITRTHAVIGGIAIIWMLALVRDSPSWNSQPPAKAPEPVAVVQDVAPTQPAPPPVATEAPKPIVAIWPEHEGLPIFREPVDAPLVEEVGYIVLLEPIGELGQLNAEIVYSAEESDPLLSNCVDIRRKLSRADLLIGEYDGIETTFSDYVDWFMIAAITFCKTTP